MIITYNCVALWSPQCLYEDAPRSEGDCHAVIKRREDWIGWVLALWRFAGLSERISQIGLIGTPSHSSSSTTSIRQSLCLSDFGVLFPSFLLASVSLALSTTTPFVTYAIRGFGKMPHYKGEGISYEISSFVMVSFYSLCLVHFLIIVCVIDLVWRMV